MSITMHENRCSGCQYCVVLCPAGAITLDIQADTQPIIDADVCTECGDCVYACPNNVFAAPDLAPAPIPLQDHYGAVVIGAGIAGLMTAAGLAKAGRNVLVLEQLSFVGGKYTHLDHDGYTINTAAWTAPGPNSRIGRLCAKLDAPIEWITIHDVPSQGASWIALHDGRRFASTDEAQETFVGGAKGMARVYDWIADMYDPGVSYPADMTTREYIERYFPGNETYIKYVETIITHCFASQTVENFPATETKRAIVDALENMADWGTARGGTEAIIRGLETALRNHGGHIATHTRVSRILVENDKATGVELADGRTIRADVVVHNAGPARLVALVGEENLPADYVARIRGLVPANVAALVLGTKESLLGPDHSMIHAMGWDRTLNCYAPTFFDPGLAPPGHHVMDVFWVMQPPYDKHAELELVKAELRDLFPTYDDVVEMELPLFYTGLWTAEMAHRKGQSGADRLDPRSPIENLYLAGYDCIGYGMAGDIIPHGVERALYLMLGDLAYAPADEKASARWGRWLKSRVFKLMALGKRLRS
ncbi:MAG: FAD-dependent oxidoreductase [Chloroflexi bacterium]|nr:FAD-dependent oxidoreductase [Chloroflexota bacterium]MBU1751739.1 FAD-dependent oxidoreductase [Chloroflexota bacterium]